MTAGITASAQGAVNAITFHGLPALALRGPQNATAIISLHGAQVLSWIPGQGRERMYLSERSDFSGSAAIRGGVPICFPQFSSQGALPKHGLVRTVTWQLLTQQCSDESTRVSLGTADSVATRELWPHAFRLTLHALLEASALTLTLQAENSGATPFIFTGALHTYLRVADINAAHVEGLDGVSYRDAAHDNRTATQHEARLSFDGETDRVYHASPSLALNDAAGNVLSIEATGFHDTVVWNPGPTLCANLPDMPAEGYRHMLCMEAASADSPVTLGPGQSWEGSQRLQSLPNQPASPA